MLQISLPQTLTTTKRSDPLHTCTVVSTRIQNSMETTDILQQNSIIINSFAFGSLVCKFFFQIDPLHRVVAVKVGVLEFLNGVGKGVEAHVEKLELEIGDIQKLLVARTLKLKKLGIPCKHRKLILKYAHKYKVGLWSPQALPVKSQRLQKVAGYSFGATTKIDKICC